jgi:dynein heavy chain
MDERHWWIAGKIQESFHIGGYDNPTLLEDFMCEHTTMDVINHFLGARGPRRLFFYCDKPESGQMSTRELHVAQNLANLKDVNLEEATVLYFVRKDVEKDVDASHMEKDVFCGELKSSTMETLTSLLSDIFIPMLRAQKDWGDCTQESKAQLLVNMEKYLGSLSDSTSSASIHSSKQMVRR